MKTIRSNDGIAIITNSGVNDVGVVHLTANANGSLTIASQTLGNISSVLSIVNAGINYQVSDVLTVVGSGTGAVLRVTSIASGAGDIDGLEVISGGSGYDPTQVEVYTVTGGAGTLFTFTGVVPSAGLTVGGANATTSFAGTTTIDKLNGTVWPVDSGIADQIITTDGSGNGSWVTPTLDFLDDVNAPTPSEGDLLTRVSGEWINQAPTVVKQSVTIACGTETAVTTTGTAKVTFHFPTDFTIIDVFAGLNVVQTSGSTFTVDVNKNGSSIFSTVLTIDNAEETSLTAAVPAVLSVTSITKGDKITVDVDQVGDNTAAGLKVYITGYSA